MADRVCNYPYPPSVRRVQRGSGHVIKPDFRDISSSPNCANGFLAPEAIVKTDDGFEDGSFSLLHQQLQGRLKPQACLGLLGDLEPVTGKGRWSWAFNQIRDYPTQFASQAETAFIHRSTMESEVPAPLQAAFGISALCSVMNEFNRPIVFKTLDAEIMRLLNPASGRSLVEELAILQAATLYQIIRLWHGGVEQRMIAEQQEFPQRSYALTLLRRADAELETADRNWEKWVLAESVRRTVLVTFKLYTLYWAFKNRVCAEIPGLDILPVSTKGFLWDSPARYLEETQPDEIVTHEVYTKTWFPNPSPDQGLFHTMLIVGCKVQPGEGK